MTVAVRSSVCGVSVGRGGYVKDAPHSCVAITAGEVERVARVLVQLEGVALLRVGEEETGVASHLHGVDVGEERAERLLFHGGVVVVSDRGLEHFEFFATRHEGGQAGVVPVGVVHDGETATHSGGVGGDILRIERHLTVRPEIAAQGRWEMVLEIGGYEDLVGVVAGEKTGEMRFFNVVDGHLSGAYINDGEAEMTVVGGGREGAEEIALPRRQEGFFDEGSSGNQPHDGAVQHRALPLLSPLLCLGGSLPISCPIHSYFHLIAYGHFQTLPNDLLQVIVDCEIGDSAERDILIFRCD